VRRTRATSEDFETSTEARWGLKQVFPTEIGYRNAVELLEDLAGSLSLEKA
jgi:hypothetical protein